MLSYRHSFHAGNFADIIKHGVQVGILDHLIQKDTPFDYIDTHSGAGLFDLHSDHAKKLEEHHRGISRLLPADFPELSHYFAAIESYNEPDSLDIYPGSPAIASYFLRQQDRGWLYELHPEDYRRLSDNMKDYKKIRVSHEDGLHGMLSLLPPISRRSLVLIDPAYEVKAEYDQVLDAIAKAHKKFATGIYAIWYPVVDRHRIERMERQFIASNIRNIQRFELGLVADSNARGMTAAGVFVINPPWTLFNHMQRLLPRLLQALDDSDEGFFKCDIIVNE